MLDVDNTSVCLFFYCSGKCQPPSAHHGATTETAASRLIHIHSQIKSALYCCFQLLALCSPSASADFQALLFWNIPACWTWAAPEHVGIGSLSGLLLGNVHCEWQRWSPGWRMDGKCFFFFLADHLPSQRKGCVFHYLTAHVERSPLCQRKCRK